MDFFLNPWIVGTGTTVVAGLILYYLFGVGKTTNKNHIVPEETDIQGTSRQKEYEMELESFRNDMVRRGLAHTSIRLNGEAGLRTKYGILAPSVINEIELNVDGTIYRLTNQTNNDKYERAKIDAGPDATSEQVLAHYDKLGGYVQYQDGTKVDNGLFWSKEKKRLEVKKRRNEFLKQLREITSHPVIVSSIIIILLAILWYIFGIDLSHFQ